MTTRKITINDYSEAAEFLITLESLIKAARAVYHQVNHNELPIDSDTKLMLLGELEERGLLLAKLKVQVLHVLDMRALPVTLESI